MITYFAALLVFALAYHHGEGWLWSSIWWALVVVVVGMIEARTGSDAEFGAPPDQPAPDPSEHYLRAVRRFDDGGAS